MKDSRVLRLCVVAAGFGVFLTTTACAGVRYRPIPPEDVGPGDGIVYYESSLYLLIYSDGKGGLAHKILQLPDPTKKRVASPYSTLSSLDLTLTFTDGYLTQSTQSGDTSAVPVAVMKAVTSVVPGILARGGGKEGIAPDEKTIKIAPEHCVPAPYLYKIVVHGDRVGFYGEAGDEPIYASLVDQKAPSK